MLPAHGYRWQCAGRTDDFRRILRQSTGPRASRAGTGRNASTRQCHGPRGAAPLQFIHGVATVGRHAVAPDADGAAAGDDARAEALHASRRTPAPAPSAISPTAPRSRPRPTRRSSTFRNRCPSSPSEQIRDQNYQGLTDVTRYVPERRRPPGRGQSRRARHPRRRFQRELLRQRLSRRRAVFPRPVQRPEHRGAEGPERADLRPRRRRRRCSTARSRRPTAPASTRRPRRPAPGATGASRSMRAKPSTRTSRRG